MSEKSVFEKFKEFLVFPRGMKEATIVEYQRYIRLVYQEANRDILAPQLTHTEFTNLLLSLAQKHVWKVPTFRKASYILGCFLQWAHREGITGPPTFKNTFRKEKPPRPRWMTEEEAERVIWNPQNSLIDVLATLILWDTGMRPGELASVTLKDVNLRDRLILLRKTKGDRTREVPFTKITRRVLSHYLRILRLHIELVPETPLILSEKWLGHTANGMSKHVKKICGRWSPKIREAGITAKVFRHSLGGRLVERGADLSVVKEILGHENISTTADYYMHFRANQTREIYDKFSSSRGKA